MTLTISNTDHLDGVAYLFGYPISHSLSPLFHNTVYQALGLKWEQQFLESTDMAQFLRLTRQPKFVGASVTMPHKLAVLEHLDELTEEGREVGACNTVFLREKDGKKKLVGANTDVIGIREAFYQNIKDPDAVFHDRPGMVIGGGGAARSAVYALHKWMRASPIYIVNRDSSEVDAVIQECTEKGYGNGLIHVKSVDQAKRCEGPGAIVSCVPDFPPVTENEVITRKIIETILAKPHKGAILEMAYKPIWTEIAKLSEAAGWNVILGTEAMIWQGFEQDRYWTGRSFAEMPIAEAQAAIALKLKEMGL